LQAAAAQLNNRNLNHRSQNSINAINNAFLQAQLEGRNVSRVLASQAVAANTAAAV